MDIKQTLLSLSSAHLKRVIRIKERIESLETQLQDLLEAPAPPGLPTVVRTRRRMSAAARARIARAAKERWAAWRAAKGKK